MEEEKWKRLDGSSVVFDGEGRMKMLATCKCGATAWVRQGKIFKRFFTGRCPSCGAFLLARVKRVRVEAVEAEDGEYRIRDVDLLTAHLVDVAIRTVDPVLYDAALMLNELHEKHWNECLQIGLYSDKKPSIRRTEDEHPPFGEVVLVWGGLCWELARFVNDCGCYLWETEPYDNEHDYVHDSDCEYWTYLPNDPRKECADD